ncbi:hypothetical protein M0R45_018103 [Rubus argutus]|uniref:Uncharacterized protein n=1 Tax=Rubus argutus TaxID=59490 RepID=A0AAW1X2F7_RUBAR
MMMAAVMHHCSSTLFLLMEIELKKSVFGRLVLFRLEADGWLWAKENIVPAGKALPLGLYALLTKFERLDGP